MGEGEENALIVFQLNQRRFRLALPIVGEGCGRSCGSQVWCLWAGGGGNLIRGGFPGVGLPTQLSAAGGGSGADRRASVTGQPVHPA